MYDEHLGMYTNTYLYVDDHHPQPKNTSDPGGSQRIAS